MKQTRILKELSDSGRFDGALSLSPIEGGTINDNFILTQGNTRYHLKTFELNHLAPIDRQATFDLQNHVAAFGRAPKLHYLSLNHDFQVEDWVPHTPLTTTELSRSEQIHCLASTLFDIHGLPTFAISLDLPSDWQMYIEMAGITLNDDLNQKLDDAHQAWLGSHQQDQVLCHNDLNLEHIALGEPALVFDWEYAACGNRYFDIAACAKINQLTEAELQQLCHYYADKSEVDAQHVSDQVTAQMPLVTLTYELWYRAAETVPGIEKLAINEATGALSS